MATLGQYMTWLESVGGECRFGMRADEVLGMVPVVKLIAPDGRFVIHPDGDRSEVLAPSVVEYYDRRLQLASPFSHPKAN